MEAEFVSISIMSVNNPVFIAVFAAAIKSSRLSTGGLLLMHVMIAYESAIRNFHHSAMARTDAFTLCMMRPSGSKSEPTYRPPEI